MKRLLTCDSIIDCRSAYEATINNISKEEELIKEELSKIIDYINSKITDACVDKKFSTHIKFNKLIDECKIKAIEVVINYLKDETFYNISNHKSKTERGFHGETNISFTLSWGVSENKISIPSEEYERYNLFSGQCPF